MSETIPAVPVPSLADIERICSVSDPVLRNLQITQCYSELSAAMPQRTGAFANWCTFATWASKQAGQTIRKEDLVRALESFLNDSPEAVRAVSVLVSAVQQLGASLERQRISDSILEVMNPAAAFDRSSDAVARGNKKVFAEIGREFARFYSACLQDSFFDEQRINGFCQDLSSGDPPDGQEYLRQAFTNYYRAFFESDPKTRAELMLLANVRIGFHEQTRLQPEIAEALEAAIPDPRVVTERFIQALFPNLSWIARGRLLLRRVLGGQTVLDLAVGKLLAIVRQKVRGIVTELMMSLTLAQGVQLRLGQDLKGGFPVSLRHISNPELQALLERVDPSPNSLHNSGAEDWADLPDRLHFIVDLFRCYQEWPHLFDAPFNAKQIEAIRQGQHPEGSL